MKNKALKILNLIFALFLAVFSISYVFAWFADGTKVPLNVGGQASAYFAYGDGTESDPYGITDPIHLYNLSWLQNSGKFDDTTYYFEINENLEGALDMSGYWLAPIGNFEHPFKGVFNGSGKTIKGLQVTTNKSLLQSNDPAKYSSYLFSNAVGFFGKTGSSAQIRNFILDNPKVEVEAGDEMYCSTTETGTDGQVVDTKVVGFAVGEDNGSTTDGTTTTAAISNIGVIGGVLSVQRADYQTKNAIIGSTALQGSTDGDTTSGNTGYFDPTYMQGKASTNSNFEGDYLKNNRFIVSTIDSGGQLGELGLGAFSILTAEGDRTAMSLDDRILTLSFSSDDKYQLSVSGNTTYPQYIINDADTSLTDDIKLQIDANTDFTTEENLSIKNKIDTVNELLAPLDGWNATTRPQGTFQYFLRTGSRSDQVDNMDASIYQENGAAVDDGKTVTLTYSRSIRFDIKEMSDGSTPSIIMVVTNNSNSSDMEVYLQRYNVVTSSGNAAYLNYSYLTSDSVATEQTVTIDNVTYSTSYTYEILEGETSINIIAQELPNISASYGITTSGSARIYFMRVVGVAGTDTYGEGSLDSIDFIAEGDTMVYSNGTVTFNYVETGTLIGLSGNGASIIIGFIREATTVGEGDSATTTYTFSVTYSAVVATEPGSTYSPNPTVSNVVTVGENESFTGSEDSLFPGSLSS